MVLGYTILKAKSFVIALGDNIIYSSEKAVSKQMIEKYFLQSL